jgi:hypothetical protein
MLPILVCYFIRNPAIAANELPKRVTGPTETYLPGFVSIVSVEPHVNIHACLPAACLTAKRLPASLRWTASPCERQELRGTQKIRLIEDLVR